MRMIFKNNMYRDFPGGPVVKTVPGSAVKKKKKYVYSRKQSFRRDFAHPGQLITLTLMGYYEV